MHSIKRRNSTDRGQRSCLHLWWEAGQYWEIVDVPKGGCWRKAGSTWFNPERLEKVSPHTRRVVQGKRWQNTWLVYWLITHVTVQLHFFLIGNAGEKAIWRRLRLRLRLIYNYISFPQLLCISLAGSNADLSETTHYYCHTCALVPYTFCNDLMWSCITNLVQRDDSYNSNGAIIYMISKQTDRQLSRHDGGMEGQTDTIQDHHYEF